MPARGGITGVKSLKPEGAYDLLVKAHELEQQGHSVINLGIGQPDFPSPPAAVAAAKEALDKGKTTYCNSSGTAELKAALAKHMLNSRGAHVNPEEVVVFPGCKPAMWFACTLLLQPGDEVLIPDPGFPTYAEMIICLGATPIYYNGLLPLSCTALARQLTPRTRLVIVNSPGNPTGRVASAEELAAIADTCVAHSRVWVMSDEIYGSVYYGEVPGVAPANAPSMLACLPIRDRLVVVDGFSKTWSMTGWRLGFAICPLFFAERMHVIAMHAIGCTALFSQIGAVEAVRANEAVKDILRVYRQRRDYVVHRLNGMHGITCEVPGGAFYVFPRCVVRAADGSEVSTSQLSSELLEAGVACLPGDCFGPRHGCGHLRLSYVSDIEQLREGLDRMEACLHAKALQSSCTLDASASAFALPALSGSRRPKISRVLVLGARGFIGGHMAEHFTAQGHEVVLTGSRQLNLLDRTAVSAFFDKQTRFDLVVHCCAKGGSRLMQDAAQVLQDNVKMLDTVLAQRERYGRIVYFSSGAATTAKDTPYGFSKHLADIMLRNEPNAYNCRVFGCFGPGEPQHRMITSCLRRRNQGKVLEVHADRQFDFIYIKDLCRLVELMLDDDVMLPHEIDAVYQKKTTLLEVAGTMSNNVTLLQEEMAPSYIGNTSGTVEAALGGTLIGLHEGIALLAAHMENGHTSYATPCMIRGASP